jgi:hypothetical protein
MVLVLVKKNFGPGPGQKKKFGPGPGTRTTLPISTYRIKEKNKMKRGENKWCVLHHNRSDKERAEEN